MSKNHDDIRMVQSHHGASLPQSHRLSNGGLMHTAPDPTACRCLLNQAAASNAAARTASGQPRNDSHKIAILQQPRPSLAATHPTQYAAPTASDARVALSGPTMKALAQSSQTAQVSHDPQSRTPSQSNSSQQTAKSQSPPWRIYTDPMRQTNWRGVPDSTGPLIVQFRADQSCEMGNVVSPVPLVKLPFGGLIEVAKRYPENSSLECDEDQCRK